MSMWPMMEFAGPWWPRRPGSALFTQPRLWVDVSRLCRSDEFAASRHARPARSTSTRRTRSRPLLELCTSSCLRDAVESVSVRWQVLSSLADFTDAGWRTRL